MSLSMSSKMTVFCFGLALVFTIAPTASHAFSFPFVDFVNINTGFDTGAVVPGKDDAPRWDAEDFTLGTGNIFDGRSLAGGITYNYESNFRINFTWDLTPTQLAFDAAIGS